MSDTGRVSGEFETMILRGFVCAIAVVAALVAVSLVFEAVENRVLQVVIGGGICVLVVAGVGRITGRRL